MVKVTLLSAYPWSEVCVNFYGGYRCDCEQGYARQGKFFQIWLQPKLDTTHNIESNIISIKCYLSKFFMYSTVVEMFY